MPIVRAPLVQPADDGVGRPHRIAGPAFGPCHDEAEIEAVGIGFEPSASFHAP